MSWAVKTGENFPNTDAVYVPFFSLLSPANMETVHFWSDLFWLWLSLLAIADLHFSGLTIHINMLVSKESVKQSSFYRISQS